MKFLGCPRIWRFPHRALKSPNQFCKNRHFHTLLNRFPSSRFEKITQLEKRHFFAPISIQAVAPDARKWRKGWHFQTRPRRSNIFRLVKLRHHETKHLVFYPNNEQMNLIRGDPFSSGDPDALFQRRASFHGGGGGGEGHPPLGFLWDSSVPLFDIEVLWQCFWVYSDGWTIGGY